MMPTQAREHHDIANWGDAVGAVVTVLGMGVICVTATAQTARCHGVVLAATAMLGLVIMHRLHRLADRWTHDREHDDGPYGV